MAVSTYMHGVTWRDVPTSIVAPVTADSGIPVAVGAAPSFLAESPAPVNTPRIYFTYEEFVAEMGFSYDFQSYGLCEFAYCQFVLFNVGPIICINVFDTEATGGTGAPVTDSPDLINGKSVLNEQNVILSTVVVKDDPGGTITYVRDTDYTVGYQTDGTVAIIRIPTGAIPGAATKIKVTRAHAVPTIVDKTEIIGGVDSETGKGTGLEAIEDVYPALQIIPGILIAPGFSQEPEVAAVLASKAENINGCFRCTAFADIDSEEILKAQDVSDWKNENNYVSNRLTVFWPRVAIDEKQFWLSTQAAALTEFVDQKNGNLPYESPSNKNLKMNRSVIGDVGDPQDTMFGKSYADMLNGSGVVSCINWIGGWKLWGNNQSIYPSNSDPKDRWIPVRRMTDWLGNTIVLTVYQFVDRPGNRRLIDSIIDSLNMWLNSLVGQGALNGARVEFIHSENPDTELINGHYKFHVYQAAPIPAEWIEFLIEFDTTYLQTLFTPVASQGESPR